MKRRARILGCAATVAFSFLVSGPRASGAGCTVSSSGVAFGSYSVFGVSATNTTGTVAYSCTLPADAPSIALGAGNSLAFSTRLLRSAAGDSLQYNLCRDAGCASVWGDGTAGTSLVQAGGASSGEATIFGRIPARQNVRAGDYTDSIVLTISF